MKTPAAISCVVVLGVLIILPTLRSSQETAPVHVTNHRKLRVCADPNNLPFSNNRREGFENRIAELISEDLGADLEYTWWAQRRGNVRNTLKAGLCDVLIGVPVGLESVLTTKPYYRSSYVFVSRASRALHITSLDAPELRKLLIGVQLVGDDGTNTPPAHALARRGIIRNVRGYSVVGDYSKPNPPARVIEAVDHGDIDVAVAWGPMAGFFAKRSREPLIIVPVLQPVDAPSLPFVYEISMGVRRGDVPLRNQLNQVIDRRRAQINKILADFGVPALHMEGT
jgi:mxaJ protein